MSKAPTCHFQCNEYKPKNDGGVEYYLLEVGNEVGGETEIIQLTPNELISSQSMKRILLGRKIFYSVSQREHEKIIERMFEKSPIPI